MQKKLGELTTQELNNKLRNRWGLIALILLACTLLQSSLALALCDSFEPYGSCPDVNLAIRPNVSYVNDAYISGSSGFNASTGYSSAIVYFNYTSFNGTENVTYVFANKGNTSGQCYSPISSPTNIAANNTCFNVIHSFIINGTSGKTGGVVLFKPTKMDPRFEFWLNNKWQLKWAFETNVTYLAFTFDSNTKTLYRIVRYEAWDNNTNDSTTVNYSISIKGKSINVLATENSARFYQWNWDSTETYNNITLSVVQVQNNSVDMALTADFIIINNITKNSSFYRVGTIYDKSDFTTYENSAGLTKANLTKVNNANTAFYHNLTGLTGARNSGRRRNMSETFVITISYNPYDMMLYNNNTVSPYYDTLKNEWTYEYWASNGSANRSQIYNETLRLANYGMNLDKANLRMYSMASGNPGRWNFSGTSSDIATQVYNFGTSLANLGVRLYYYNSLQDGEPGDIFTIDQNTYFGTTTYAANYSYLSQNSNGQNETSFGNDAHISYCMRQNMLTTVLIANATRWASTGMYLDTEGANLVHDYYDARINTSYVENGRKRFQIICQQNYSNILHNNGFILTTENQGGFYSAGRMDQGEAAISSSAGGSTGNKGLMPYDIIIGLSEKMVLIDEGLRRCMFNWNDTNKWKYGVYGSDETQFQRCFTRARALRATTHLDGFTYDLHNLPDNLTIQMYYMSYELGKLEYAGDLKNETYFNQEGNWMDLSTALTNGYDWKNASFHQEYTNGLHLYINLRSQSNHWLNITANGATRNIPPNGFYAYMEDGSFEEFYNDNDQSHWVYAKNSFAYFYPKFSSVTFRFPEDDYTFYEFYANEASNGKRVVASRQDITSYTTSNPTYVEFTNTEFACVNGVSQGTSGLNNSLAVLALVIIMVIIARWLTNGMTLIELSLWTTGIIVMSIYAIIMMGIGSICT